MLPYFFCPKVSKPSTPAAAGGLKGKHTILFRKNPPIGAKDFINFVDGFRLKVAII